MAIFGSTPIGFPGRSGGLLPSPASFSPVLPTGAKGISCPEEHFRTASPAVPGGTLFISLTGGLYIRLMEYNFLWHRPTIHLILLGFSSQEGSPAFWLPGQRDSCRGPRPGSEILFGGRGGTMIINLNKIQIKKIVHLNTISYKTNITIIRLFT